ncbi:DUF58 domain-containing protein [Gudongella sp. SC589]|jgi:uncharacterized protein (DUF58 family)|uniref:DUF58 domain-containing protein n=1 Tax=Gudongella sp. SC589 TaxID=3385990 RepID=UPI003904D18C
MNRNLIVALILLLFSLVFVLLVGGKIPYLIFHALSLYLLLPLIHSLLGLYVLSGSVSIPSGEFYAGDTVEIKYLVKNNSYLLFPFLIFTPDLSYEIGRRKAEDLLFSLKSHESYTKTEKPTLKRRGYYDMGGFHLTINDVFGLYSLKKHIKSDISILILPEISKINSFQIPAGLQSGELLVSQSAYRDKSRISALREYRDGDSIRAIHWKATSKKEVPVIKEFEARSDTYVEVFLDSFSPHYRNDINRRIEDKAVEVAVSIIHYCLSNNISIAVNYENDNKHYRLEGRDYEDLKTYLESLARYSAAGSLNLEELIHNQSPKIQKGSSTILITPSLDSTNGSTAMNLAYRGMNPIVVAISDKRWNTGTIDGYLTGKLQEDNIPVFRIDCSQGISDILEVSHGWL